MDNLYQTSKLLSKLKFEKISKALTLAWKADTTYPDDMKSWTEENKALGHCAITAAIIYDLLDGKLIYDKENFHIWNELPDKSQQDFSRSQFKEDRIFSVYKYKTKEEVLYDENGLKTNASGRYKLLKERFEAEFNKLSKTTGKGKKEKSNSGKRSHKSPKKKRS